MLKRLAARVLAALLIFTSTFPPVAAAEGNPWMAVAGALTAAAVYNVYFKEIMDYGNNPLAQEETKLYDRQANGESPNKQQHELVNRVMERLTRDGIYELEHRSLPFRWNVNDSSEFNAACFPTNYISINRGLVEGMNGNEDQLASVLGHEMIHGIRQHAARNYAKQMAAVYGSVLVGAATGIIDGGIAAMMADTAVAKMISVPTEYEADEGGFYLAADAGFNPGGGAAAMVRMQHITDKESEFKGKYDPYDHPETQNREKKLAELMTKYSVGHVRVDRNDVYIEDEKLISTQWTDMNSGITTEHAYLVAGALARAFHDCDTLTAWNWRTGADGLPDYLDDRPVYAPLKQLVADHRAQDRLKRLVEAAYREEVVTGERSEMLDAESARLQLRRLAQEKNRLIEQKYVEYFQRNGDYYNDLFLPELAIREASRSFGCTQAPSQAKTYAVIGRAKAMQGNFADGLADVERALYMKEDAFNYLSRSEVYRAMGDAARAMEDCRRAMALDPQFSPSWRIAGDIAAELGQKEQALAFYRDYLDLEPEAVDIPEEYLEQLDPKRLERIRQERARREAERRELEKQRKAEENEKIIPLDMDGRPVRPEDAGQTKRERKKAARQAKKAQSGTAANADKAAETEAAKSDKAAQGAAEPNADKAAARSGIELNENKAAQSEGDAAAKQPAAR